MKPIKITRQNATAIEAALRAVNGMATAYTFSTYFEIEATAAEAERRLSELGIAKSRHVGSMFACTSGSAVPGAYAKKGALRVVTRIAIERRPAGWYLTKISRAEVFQLGRMRWPLYVTAAQRDEAWANVAAKFVVLQPFGQEAGI